MDIEKLKERLESLRVKKESKRYTYDALYNDIAEYLTSKFPDMKAHEAKELSGFISCRVNIIVADAINERDMMWQKQLKSSKPIRRKKYDQT